MRKPRFEREPGEDNLRITERDIRIFQYLDRYRLLSSDQLRRLAGGGSQGFIRRLQQLYHTGFVERPLAQRDFFFRQQCREMIYALSAKSTRLLYRLGMREKATLPHQKHLRPFFLTHAVFLSEIMARIECDARTLEGVRFVIHNAEHETFPGKPERRVRPDAVFILEIQHADAAKRIGVLVEADCGTEPVRRKSTRQSSIVSFIKGFVTLWEQGTWASKYDLQRIRVLIVSQREERTKNILCHAGEHLPRRGSGMFLMVDEKSFLDSGNVLTSFFAVPDGKSGSILG